MNIFLYQRQDRPDKETSLCEEIDLTYAHRVWLMKRIAEKHGFQMGTLVEVRQRNDNQWPNSCFCYYCG